MVQIHTKIKGYVPFYDTYKQVLRHAEKMLQN